MNRPPTKHLDVCQIAVKFLTMLYYCPRKNNASNSFKVSLTQVGRPWLHWLLRGGVFHITQEGVHFRQGKLAAGTD